MSWEATEILAFPVRHFSEKNIGAVLIQVANCLGMTGGEIASQLLADIRLASVDNRQRFAKRVLKAQTLWEQHGNMKTDQKYNFKGCPFTIQRRVFSETFWGRLRETMGNLNARVVFKQFAGET